MSNVVVIGAGIAGLTAAIRAAQNGHRVKLISMGVGGLQLSQGTLDVYRDKPFAPAVAPDHPYYRLGPDRVAAAMRYYMQLVGGMQTRQMVADNMTIMPMDEERIDTSATAQNLLLPTALGAIRPTFAAPVSMAGGHLEPGKKLAIVGISEYKDYYPELIAGNLNRQELPGGGRVEATPYWVSFPARRGEADSTPVALARRLDDPLARRDFARALLGVLPGGDYTIGLPAVLGLEDQAAHRDMEVLLGHPVFEIVSLPPSVPGIRLNNQMLGIARGLGVRHILGAHVVGAVTEGDRVVAVKAHTAGRDRLYYGDHFIHCPGGFESGGLKMDSYGQVSEPVFGLEVARTDGQLLNADWFTPQPLFATGLEVDEQMRPVAASARNLTVAGGIIAGAERWHEKSGEGIAIATALAAADAVEEN